MKNHPGLDSINRLAAGYCVQMKGTLAGPVSKVIDVPVPTRAYIQTLVNLANPDSERQRRHWGIFPRQSRFASKWRFRAKGTKIMHYPHDQTMTWQSNNDVDPYLLGVSFSDVLSSGNWECSHVTNSNKFNVFSGCCFDMLLQLKVVAVTSLKKLNS
eukprot:Gb_31272 [translate_table: standard]